MSVAAFGSLRYPQYDLFYYFCLFVYYLLFVVNGFIVCYLLLVLLRGHLWLWEAGVYGQVPPSQEGNNLLPRPLPEKYDTEIARKM